MSDASPAELALTEALLADVFPGTRVSDPAYLKWLYADGPDGEAIAANLDDDAGRAGHYVVIPCTLRERGRDVAAALSLNTAVHERARGGGVFTRLAQAAYADAAARGVEAVVGVANANSTPGFTRRLEFALLGPLPAQVLVPTPGRPGVKIAGGLPDDARLGPLLDAAADAGEATARWRPETLRWRLAAPRAEYAVHDGGDWIAVTTVDRSSRVPVAVILAVLASRPLSGAESSALVRRACRRHRAPLALHVGHNDRLALRGLPLPQRLRPSPLNLIFRRLAGDGAPPAFARFELLDFDAY
jgi:GNAT superfamily N-acetyltransferase